VPQADRARTDTRIVQATIDGGPLFAAYAQPVLDDFRKEFKADAVTATALWPVMRRMGHRQEFLDLVKIPPERPFIALKEVNGCNLETENGRFGLGQAAYSCG
jgi:hypothetical protein